MIRVRSKEEVCCCKRATRSEAVGETVESRAARRVGRPVLDA